MSILRRTVPLLLAVHIAAVYSFSATDVWSSHITNTPPWKTYIYVFNPAAGTTATFTLNRYDDAGAQIGASSLFNITSFSWALVGPSELNYSGSAHLTSSADLLVKVTYQYAESQSLCEFYLTDATGTTWVIPNSLHDWFVWTGVALVNPYTSSTTATLEAYRAGVKIAEKNIGLSPKGKYAALSDGIWFGVRYQDFDTVIIKSPSPIPAPISITSDAASNRHVFFTGQKINVSPPTLPAIVLYLKAGDPAGWISPGAAGSQAEEIKLWKSAGYNVVTRDLRTTAITSTLLNSYGVLRFNGAWLGQDRPVSDDEGLAIYNWVLSGGRLMADVSFTVHVPAIRQFGVNTIEGQNGGSSGWGWYFYGSPLTIGPVTGPSSSVSSFAASAMDHPVLASGNLLTVDATASGYPAIVHGAFGRGRIVTVFAQFWSHDAPYPGHAFNSTIYQAGNLQFLRNCIQYLQAVN